MWNNAGNLKGVQSFDWLKFAFLSAKESWWKIMHNLSEDTFFLPPVFFPPLISVLQLHDEEGGCLN